MSKKKVDPATLTEAERIYLNIKDNRTMYDERLHCTMLIEVLLNPEGGTMSAFCKKAFISDSTFYSWCNRYTVFRDCYRYGIMAAKEIWEKQGREGQHDPDFNMEYWKQIGSMRYSLGKSNKVRLEIDSEATPYDQYTQLINQSSNGDFTAAELKQIMECINVGRNVYESFKLQQEVDKMREDLLKMSQGHGDNIIPIEKVAKTN
jgi:hypothetical protein